MAKSANLNIRIDPDVKADAEQLFSQFGITISDAVNIFIHQSLMERRIPFEIRQPRYNAETEAAMHEAKDIIDGKIEAKEYVSARELFDELDKEIEAEPTVEQKGC